MPESLNLANPRNRKGPINSNFPYGKDMEHTLNIEKYISPYDVQGVHDTVHEEGAFNVYRALNKMPPATSRHATDVIKGTTQGMMVPVGGQSTKGSSYYNQPSGLAWYDQGEVDRTPVLTTTHETSHGYQTIPNSTSNGIEKRSGVIDRNFTPTIAAARELGPSLLGHAAEAEARRRGGTPVPHATYDFPSGYSPSLEFNRRQMERFGLFGGSSEDGKRHSIDELLATNPNYLKTIAEQPPAASQSLDELPPFIGKTIKPAIAMDNRLREEGATGPTVYSDFLNFTKQSPHERDASRAERLFQNHHRIKDILRMAYE